MKRKKNKSSSKLSKQMKDKTEEDKKQSSSTEKEAKKAGQYAGNMEKVVSTGSTLLDLAISGKEIRGGGIPAGIFVEIFGPSSTGKTVLLCEIAGGVQRAGGETMFRDPEARLDKHFAKLFGFDADQSKYDHPDTVPEVFEPIREWEPENPDKINGVFADSLAALSTDQEMEGKDAYGARRAKEFSEQLRRTCRVITEKDYIVVGTNQERDNMNAAPFGKQYRVPGGRALKYYASLRLRFKYAKSIKKKKKFKGKKIQKVIGIKAHIEVEKNSVSEPNHEADVTILFDYGIDNIRDNLQFIKDYSKHNYYTLGGKKLHAHMSKAIKKVEKGGEERIKQLREEVIDLWEEIQEKFKTNRRPKQRFQ